VAKTNAELSSDQIVSQDSIARALTGLGCSSSSRSEIVKSKDKSPLLADGWNAFMAVMNPSTESHIDLRFSSDFSVARTTVTIAMNRIAVFTIPLACAGLISSLRFAAYSKSY